MKALEALSDAINHAVAPDARYAYDRCRICGQTWWGRSEWRREQERHMRDCPVPEWRAALASAKGEG